MQPCKPQSAALPLSSHRQTLQQQLQQRLRVREEAGLLRQRLHRDSATTPEQSLDGRQLISFCSNDYLGLANHPLVIESLQRAARQYGVGSGASHLVTGHCSAHQALEEELAAYTGRDRALLFSTGYMANTGVINALMHADGLVLQDALNHASLLDGGWLARASSRRYPHSDMNSLEQELQATEASHVLVASDGVFSMDGDIADLQSLVRISRENRAWLMIDDAHGIGCLGDQGRGVIEAAAAGGAQRQQYGQDEVPILVGTLGKAFGTSGAFVAGDETLIEYLLQFTRSYVFTTALPPAIAEASRSSLRLIQQESWRRERLQSLIGRFRTEVRAMGLPLLHSATPIQAVVFGNPRQTLRAAAMLNKRGLQVSGIRPPTVPQNTSRLRITFSAAHTDAHLQALVDALGEVSIAWHQGSL